MAEEKKPKLIISEYAYDKVMHWVHKANFEVSGLGLVEIDPETGDAYVIDAFLLQQEGSAAETEIKAEAINKLEYDLRENKNGELRWWWHSHVNMNVFWSGTDKDTINKLGKEGWFFHTVFNKKNEMLSASSCPQEVQHPWYPGKYIYFQDKIETEIESYVDEGFAKACDEEFEKNVKHKSWGFGRDREVHGESGKWVLKNGHWVPKEESKKERKARIREEKEMLYETLKESKARGDVLSRAEVLAEIEDCFQMGWTNHDIQKYLEDEIKMYEISVIQERDQYIRLYAAGYGG